jgi:hypothetical protein
MVEGAVHLPSRPDGNNVRPRLQKPRPIIRFAPAVVQVFLGLAAMRTLNVSPDGLFNNRF